MQSEGPYKHSTKKGKCVASCTACVYEEGRKAAEKDFDELLELANRMVAFSGPQFQAVNYFKVWKKARGIE